MRGYIGKVLDGFVMEGSLVRPVLLATVLLLSDGRVYEEGKFDHDKTIEKLSTISPDPRRSSPPP